MPFVKFQTSPKSNGNTGSCVQAINYFAKEDKDREPSEPGFGFFTAEKENISAEDARAFIEHDKYSQGLRKDESKFFHVMIAFSEEELKGKTDKELMQFVKDNFANTYLEAGKRDEISPLELVWCAKLEHTRKYKGDDPKVQEKAKKSGQIKDGDNRHIHIVVARKTLNNRKISPLSNHFRKGKDTGAVKSGFDQDAFKTTIEMHFDDDFRFSRKKEDYIGHKLQAFRPDLFERQNAFEYFLGQVQQKIQQIQTASIPKAKEVKRFIYKFSSELKQKIMQFSQLLYQEQQPREKIKKVTELMDSNPNNLPISELIKLMKKAREEHTRKRPSKKKHKSFDTEINPVKPINKRNDFTM